MRKVRPIPRFDSHICFRYLGLATSDQNHDHTASPRLYSPVSDNARANKPYPVTSLNGYNTVRSATTVTQTDAAISTQTGLNGLNEFLGHAALMHAKVYCFAHRFLISRLEELALQHLERILLTCDASNDLFFSRLADAVHLIYESTPKISQFPNTARQLLSQYVAQNFTTLPDEGFKSLVSEGGDFMIDVAQKLAQQIATVGRSNQSVDEHIHELEMKIDRLELETQREKSVLERTEEEIRERESWNRDIPAKGLRVRGDAESFELAIIFSFLLVFSCSLYIDIAFAQ